MKISVYHCSMVESEQLTESTPCSQGLKPGDDEVRQSEMGEGTESEESSIEDLAERDNSSSQAQPETVENHLNDTVDSVEYSDSLETASEVDNQTISSMVTVDMTFCDTSSQEEEVANISNCVEDILVNQLSDMTLEREEAEAANSSLVLHSNLNNSVMSSSGDNTFNNTLNNSNLVPNVAESSQTTCDSSIEPKSRVENGHGSQQVLENHIEADKEKHLVNLNNNQVTVPDHTAAVKELRQASLMSGDKVYVTFACDPLNFWVSYHGYSANLSSVGHLEEGTYSPHIIQ